MASDDKIKDWRSTGRRKARRSLFNARAEFKCVGYTDSQNNHHGCGKTTIEPPKDAPNFFDEIWPQENRVLSSVALQADHETKDLQNNAIEDLNWRCASCHKLQDQQTSTGVAQNADKILDMF